MDRHRFNADPEVDPTMPVRKRAVPTFKFEADSEPTPSYDTCRKMEILKNNLALFIAELVYFVLSFSSKEFYLLLFYTCRY